MQVSTTTDNSSMASAEECPICYEKPEFSTVTTKCGHTFCFDCYKKHVESRREYSHKCPFCRAPISREREEEVHSDSITWYQIVADIGDGEQEYFAQDGQRQDEVEVYTNSESEEDRVHICTVVNCDY